MILFCLRNLVAISLTYKTASSTSSDSFDDYKDEAEWDESGTSSGTTGESVSSLPESSPSTPTQTEGYMIAYVFDEVISVDKAGMYDFDVELDEDTPEGWTLVWLANSSEPSEDDEIVDFFDSEGTPIEVVPADRKITLSIWLNPDHKYEPAIVVIR